MLFKYWSIKIKMLYLCWYIVGVIIHCLFRYCYWLSVHDFRPYRASLVPLSLLLCKDRDGGMKWIWMEIRLLFILLKFNHMLLYYVKFLFTCKTKQLSCRFVRFIKTIIFLKDVNNFSIQHKTINKNMV